MLHDSIPKIKLNPIVDYIDGAIVPAEDMLPASISNPNTNEPLQQQRATHPAMVERALMTAQRVHTDGDWRKLPADEKAKILDAIGAALTHRLDEIAQVESLTTGAVLQQSRALAILIPQLFQLAAQHISQVTRPVVLEGHVRLERVPWGPVALLAPWSGAAVSAAEKIASALAAGCPVILKPSELAPHSCGILAEVIAASDLPTGTFQLVNGGVDVAQTLAADDRIRAVSFTGARDDGLTISQFCAQNFKPLQMEVGGMNSLLVLADADLELAVEGIVTGLTAFNGQWHRGMGRLLIHASHYHALFKRLLERLDTLVIGDSLSPESDMGPLIQAAHLQQMETITQEFLNCGGIVHESGSLPELAGYFMTPTLVTNCQPERTLEEVFGPIASAYFFKSDEEAVALANQPDSAQVAYIYSAHDRHAYALSQSMQVANVSINAVPLLGLNPKVPRSGWGLSGLGEVGVTESIRFFSGSRAIGVPPSD